MAREGGENEMVEGFFTGRTLEEIDASPRGAPTTGSDRRRRPLYRERGHRLVTGYAAARVGPDNQGAWLGHFGPRPVGRPDKEPFSNIQI
jgi:hypothetical protein